MIYRFLRYLHHELYWAGWPHHWLAKPLTWAANRD